MKSKIPYILPVACLLCIIIVFTGLVIGIKILKDNDDSKKDNGEYTKIDEEHDTFSILKAEKQDDFKFESDFNNFPKIDSSTSNQHIVYGAFCKITGYTCNFSEHEGERYVYVEEQNEIGYEKFSDKIKTSKTHQAYVNLINGDVDLILVASLPSSEEQQLIKDKGIKLEVTPIARDAFIFMKHSDNPVESLSIEQIRNVYSGKTTNWKDLGGNDKKITAYVRQVNSGSQETMKSLVMKGEPLIELKEMMIESMIGLVNRMANDPTGIGYSFFYYKNAMTNSPTVELLDVEGIEPTKETITSGEYPLVTDVYLVMRKEDNPNPQATKLKKWFLTDNGQKTIEEVGYVQYFNK